MMRLAALTVAALSILPAAWAAEPTEADVTIVSSRANQVDMEQRKLDYRRGIRFWADMAQQAGLTYRIAGDYEMETGLAKSAVYVFHLNERLTAVQRSRMEKLPGDGASVILVGMTGSLDEQGKVTESVASKWFGLADVREHASEDTVFFVARARTPFALGNEPGFRFELAGGGRYFVARTPFSAAYLVDWELKPLPDTTNVVANSMLALRTLERSRIAWFGVPPDAGVLSEIQQQMLGASLKNLLLWAARRPFASACHWKECRTSAAVVTADVEDKFANGDAIALACHREKVKGSFFLVGSLAAEYPEVVTSLALNGEIGTHTMSHASVKDRPLEEQLAQIAEGKLALERMGVERVVGFRPPMEEFDDVTLRVVATSGLRFIYGNQLYDRAYPVRRGADGEAVWQFARVVSDDYNLTVDAAVNDAAGYRTEYLKEFRRMHDVGGLFPFSFHTTYLAAGESVDVVRSVVATLREEDVWLATFGEIVDWMEARQHVEVSTAREELTTVVRVANRGPAAVKSFPVHLVHPADPEKIEPVGTPSRGLKIRSAGSFGFVLLVDLEPDETREIKLR